MDHLQEHREGAGTMLPREEEKQAQQTKSGSGVHPRALA